MPTEDVSLAHVTFASGAVASVVNSVLSPREECYLRFDFERATVEVTHLYGYGDDDWRITPAPGCEADVTAAWKHAADGGDGEAHSGHAAQFAARAAPRCATGRRPPVTPAETRRTMALVAGIYASAFAPPVAAGRPRAGGVLRRDERRPRGVVISLRHDETEVTALADDLELFRVPAWRGATGVTTAVPPVRTLRGDLVTLYRPHDHVWHKGIALRCRTSARTSGAVPPSGTAPTSRSTTTA